MHRFRRRRSPFEGTPLLGHSGILSRVSLRFFWVGISYHAYTCFATGFILNTRAPFIPYCSPSSLPLNYSSPPPPFPLGQAGAVGGYGCRQVLPRASLCKGPVLRAPGVHHRGSLPGAHGAMTPRSRRHGGGGLPPLPSPSSWQVTGLPLVTSPVTLPPSPLPFRWSRTTRPSSLRYGTQRARSATTRWHPCTTGAPPPPSSCMTSPTQSRSRAPR